MTGVDGSVIDQVVVSLFIAPHSYTGEDVVEVSCHGGTAVARAVLERCFRLGARQAEPGEFTRRAFLNGRIDLAQAEAVADLIHAQSSEAHAASVAQLEGRLSAEVRQMRESLIHIASMLELALDFVEEDVAFLSPDEIGGALETARIRIGAALATFTSGKLVRDGVRVAIAGKPNAGKSSLLNALLNSRRAIVTDIPGTTRDYIEESALIDGELFRFIDTAGLRATTDKVELQGIELAKEMLGGAEIVCCLIDGTEEIPATSPFLEICGRFASAGVAEDAALYAVNKIDRMPEDALRERYPGALYISALTGEGLPGLKHELARRAAALKSGRESGGVLVTNIRHAECLRRSASSLVRALDSFRAQRSEEFIAVDVRQAIEALEEIIGEVVTDDILDSIFSRFCIGK